MSSVLTQQRPPGTATRRVPFVVTGVEAREVRVSGDFSGWSKEGIPLSKNPDGTWRTVLLLSPGEYQYRLRVDGAWQDHAQAVKRVPNPFGTHNCVLTVV